MPVDRSDSADGLPTSTKRSRWRPLVIAGLIGLAVLGVGGFAFLGGFDRTVSKRVSGIQTQVVRVALVDAVVGFDVTPDVLKVDRGTHVVLNVVNESDEPHDLAVDGGAQTRLLDPGESQRLDLGSVAGDSAALCTVPGHRVAGMTLEIQAIDPLDEANDGVGTTQPDVRTDST
jgi:nitrite reductase (NO-forming)